MKPRRTLIAVMCAIWCLPTLPRAQPVAWEDQQGPPVAQGPARTVPRPMLGVLDLPDGSRFTTSLYGLKVVGQLRTSKKLPYFILSGRSCYECDENISIYIHSPSDGPMKNEAEQRRFLYPGRETDYRDGKPLYEARMFFGDCIPSQPNAVVWFQRQLGDDKKWHEGVFLVTVKDDSLTTQELRHDLPTLGNARDAVQKGNCHELAGVDRPSEP